MRDVGKGDGGYGGGRRKSNKRRRLRALTTLAAFGVACVVAWAPAPAAEPRSGGMSKGIELSSEHLAALNRRRRIIVNFDANYPVVV